MGFALFRVSVVPKRQANLFGQETAGLSGDEEAELKRGIVRRAFSTFAEVQPPRGQRIYLVPVHPEEATFIGGYIARVVKKRVRASPLPGTGEEEVPDHPRAGYLL